MKDFMQWLNEKERRTAINGVYPPAYGAIHGVPPNAMTPTSASAGVALKNTGKMKGKCDELSPEMRKEAGCGGKDKKEKNPWQDSFSKTEASLSEGKKGKQPQAVVMPKSEEEKNKIVIKPGKVAMGHQPHRSGAGAHKNKKRFNKSDRNKNRSQLRYQESSWKNFLDQRVS